MDYRRRLDRLAQWMRGEALGAVLFVDEEGRRDPSLRYFTGHPGDALLFVFADGRDVLIPWDEILAAKIATADAVVPYTDFHRSLTEAFAAIVERESITGRIEVSDSTPYPVCTELARGFGGEIVCRDGGLSRAASDLRMVKDDDEISRIRRAATITNELIDELEDVVRGDARTELDVAMFLEQGARKRGAEGMSFESLIAGPSRSYGIHAFPTYTNGPFAAPGMSILDFGVSVEGYPSDVTLTVLRGKLDRKQEEMVSLVETAYARAVERCKPGVEAAEIADVVDALFASKGYTMPHSLGHGIGLEIHERPFLRTRRNEGVKLQPNTVVTIEPGLYDESAGGVRLENDVLVTASGSEMLTTSRLIRLP